MGKGKPFMEQGMSPNVYIGKKIADLRRQNKMSQEYVTIRLTLMGVPLSRPHLSLIETGRRNIRVSLLAALKIIFKCEYSDFFEGLENNFDVD